MIDAERRTILEGLGKRWGLDADDLTELAAGGDDHLVTALGISLGLEDLFGGDVEAERHWLLKLREDMGGRDMDGDGNRTIPRCRSAMACLLYHPDCIGQVADLLDEARNLR